MNIETISLDEFCSTVDAHTERSLELAICAERSDIADFLIDSGVSIFQFNNCESLLFTTIEKGLTSTAKKMIDICTDTPYYYGGQSWLNLPNFYGDTPVIIAISKKMVEIVKMLLDRNVCVCSDDLETVGEMPQEIVELLLSFAKRNDKQDIIELFEH